MTVQLQRPGRRAAREHADAAAPGTYPFQWNARRTDGTPEQEGPWSFTVSAVDDLGRASSHDARPSRSTSRSARRRRSRRRSPSRAPPPRPVASFTLTRQARVTEQIETSKGVVVRKLGTATAGPGS